MLNDKVVAKPRIAGDALPGAVSAIYAALEAGQAAGAATQFTSDAWYAYGADREDEKGARTVATGRDEITAALEADLSTATHRPEPLVCVHDGSNCLIEGRLVDRSSGEPAATTLASFQLDESGAVTRALTYRCPLIEPSRSWDAPAQAPDGRARATLDRYFEDLDAARLEAAAHSFSEDVLYSHPPYWPGSPRAEFRGRGELLEGFAARGPRKNVHEITVCIQRGLECLVEGYSRKPESGQTSQFISSMSLDEDGLIRRYASVVCDPAVGRR